MRRTQPRYVLRMTNTLSQLEATIRERASAAPDTSYTAKLLAKGKDHIAKKLGEEAVETAIASAKGDRDNLIYESADLLYHLLVLLRAHDVSLAEVTDELARREGISGIDEKNSRS